MSNHNAKPTFGGKLKTPEYYVEVRTYIEMFRNSKTQRNIAALLNSAGYRTPTDKLFDKQAVSNFLRNPAVKSN